MTLASLVRWDSVLLVQRFRSPAADAWFTHFPLLGNEVQYALGIPLLAWYAHDAGVVGLGLAFGWRGTWLQFGSVRARDRRAAEHASVGIALLAWYAPHPCP